PFFPKDKIQRKHSPRLILCGLFGVCINQLLFFIGLNMGSPIHASVIMTSNPILVLLAAFVSGQEKPNFLKGLGIVMGGTGALLLILHGVAPESGGDNLMLANLLVLLNSISYSIYIVISKSLMQTYSPLTVVRWVFIFGWLMVLPFGAQQLLNTDFGSMPTYILWDLFFIVFAVTGITYLLNTIALKYVNPSLVSFFVYLQ